MAKRKGKHGVPLYALIAAGVGAVFLTMYLLFLTSLVNLGQAEHVYFVLLVPLAASAAVFLFGGVDSLAEYTGEVWNGRLKLGGPAAIFFGVLLLGLFIPDPRGFSQSVRLKIHDSAPASIVGEVVLHLPTGPVDAQVGEHNTANFTRLPREMVGLEVEIGLEADGFLLIDPEKKHRLGQGQITLLVRRNLSPLVVRGRVLSAADQRAIAGARVIVDDRTVSTDAAGHFEVRLKPAAEARPVELQAEHSDFKTKRLDVIAVREDSSERAEATILLEPR